MREGWRPPVPSDQQTERILDDIARIGGDRRVGASLSLTCRERQLLVLLAAGHNDPQIARLLGKSPQTVKKQVENVRAKLGARTRAHAVAIGFRQFLL